MFFRLLFYNVSTADSEKESSKHVLLLHKLFIVYSTKGCSVSRTATVRCAWAVVLRLFLSQYKPVWLNNYLHIPKSILSVINASIITNWTRFCFY